MNIVIVRKKGEPRGFRQKKLKNLDSMQLEAGPRGGIVAHQVTNWV